MRIRLRTLFLITTLVAIIAFAFTLGLPEGLFTLLFFACTSTPGKNKNRWTFGGLMLVFLVGIGLFSRTALRAQMRRPNYFETASLGLFFTGRDQIQQAEVYAFLRSEVSLGGSHSSTIPFFRSGYMNIILDAEDLPGVEAEVRSKLAKAFPDLTVSIEGNSIYDSNP